MKFATGNVVGILYISGYGALMTTPPGGRGRDFSKWPPLEIGFVNISANKEYINLILVSIHRLSRS